MVTGIVSWVEGTGWVCSVHGGPMFNLHGDDPDPARDPTPKCGACITPLAPPRPEQIEEEHRRRWSPNPLRPGVARAHGKELSDVEVEYLSLDAEPGPYGGAIIGTTSDDGRPHVAFEIHAPVCPECAQGKHPNCAGWALDADDEMVPCDCGERGHTP